MLRNLTKIEELLSKIGIFSPPDKKLHPEKFLLPGIWKKPNISEELRTEILNVLNAIEKMAITIPWPDSDEEIFINKDIWEIGNWPELLTQYRDKYVGLFSLFFLCFFLPN